MLAAIVVSATIGCNTVKPDDLVGNWTMLDRSRQYLPAELRTIAPRLTLGAGGTFTAVDLPGGQIRGPAGVVVALSGPGKWALRTQDGRTLIQLTFDGGVGTQLDISNSLGSPTTLYYFVSDPDSGQRIELARGQ